MKIQLSGWSNGNWRDGEGKGTFGFSVGKKGREEWFSEEWLEVVVELPTPHGEAFQIAIELLPSFWKKCPELRHEEIKEWMIDRGDIEPSGRPWPMGQPPKYEAELTGNHLRIIRRV